MSTKKGGPNDEYDIGVWKWVGSTRRKRGQVFAWLML
jgi:hypothetical protein